MGLIKDTKAATLAQAADKARSAGRRVFTAKLNYPKIQPDLSGEIVDWSMMIEAVESRGWVLQHFTGSSDNHGRPEALCLFRLAR
ncbi:hypothetical protein GCM10029992_09740 [Glycomyces albus]